MWWGVPLTTHKALELTDIDKRRRDSVKVSVTVSAPPSQAGVDKEAGGKAELGGRQARTGQEVKGASLLMSQGPAAWGGG